MNKRNFSNDVDTFVGFVYVNHPSTLPTDKGIDSMMDVLSSMDLDSLDEGDYMALVGVFGSMIHMHRQVREAMESGQ